MHILVRMEDLHFLVDKPALQQYNHAYQMNNHSSNRGENAMDRISAWAADLAATFYKCFIREDRYKLLLGGKHLLNDGIVVEMRL